MTLIQTPLHHFLIFWWVIQNPRSFISFTWFFNVIVFVLLWSNMGISWFVERLGFFLSNMVVVDNVAYMWCFLFSLYMFCLYAYNDVTVIVNDLLFLNLMSLFSTSVWEHLLFLISIIPKLFFIKKEVIKLTLVLRKITFYRKIDHQKSFSFRKTYFFHKIWGNRKCPSREKLFSMKGVTLLISQKLYDIWTKEIPERH